MKSADQNRLFAKAFKLLSYRPRTIQEIKFRLKKISDDPELIKKTLDKLVKENLLNDQEFTSWWIDQRTRFKPKGNFALKSELLQKGVSQDIISSNLLTPSQERILAKKVLTSKQALPKPKAIQRLKYRGFSSSVIFELIDELYQKE